MIFLFSGYEILYLDHPQVTVGLDTGTGGEHSTTKQTYFNCGLEAA
jgi:hypothetical protein